MKTDLSPFIPRLLDALRQELQEYGEILALLEQQQASVLARAAEEVLQSVGSIQQQLARIQAARQQRQSCQSEIARQLAQPVDAAFATLIPLLPESYRLPVESLVRENNQLLARVQQRARQNHLLLSRSLQLMQQFINALMPATHPATYGQGGQMQGASLPGQGLYEAVG
jgi:flagellar biosynthesis/type III secretory pathway chaperone